MTIYTIGFTKKSAEEFFEALQRCGAKHLLDIRLHNTSQLAGFTKRENLRYFLKQIVNMEYHEVPSIRPVLPPPGVRRQHLYIRKYLIFKKLAIRPRAKINFDFYQVPLTPPHIEDLGFDSDSVAYQGLCTDVEWEAVLKTSSFRSVQDIYDGCLREGRWVEPGANTRSLGTVAQIQVTSVNLQEWDGERRYRFYFADETGCQYSNVTISDLAFRKFADTEVNRHGSLMAASRQITNLLMSVNRLYLRLGLARPWAPQDGDFGLRCWMQVTGIHTFPEYLGGEAFADF